MKTTILIINLFITLTSCNSNNDNSFTPTLPAITQTGANTFGCYIDGKLLVPRDGDGSFNLPSHGATHFVTGTPPTDYNSSLTIHDYTGNARLLQLYIENVQNGEGLYQIKESNCQDFAGGNPNPSINIYCRLKDEQTGENKYYCSIENSGNLNITRYDYSNGIISGTFDFNAVNKDDSNDIIEITEGRFDISWRTINETEFP